MEKQQKNTKKTFNTNILIKIAFIVFCFMFSVPSIKYYLDNGTIFKFNTYYKFLLNNTDIKMQTVYYLIVLLLVTVTYFVIIKNKKYKATQEFYNCKVK